MKTKCDYCNEEVEVGLLNHIIHASTCTNTKNTYKALTEPIFKKHEMVVYMGSESIALFDKIIKNEFNKLAIKDEKSKKRKTNRVK